MVGKHREVELKFSLEAVRADDVLSWLGQGRRPTAERLVSTYYDTPDLSLRKAGLSLRVRSEAGAYVQTVKSYSDDKGRLGRGEWSAVIVNPGPDLPAARRTPAKRQLESVVALTPLFSVSVERLKLELRSPDSVIEAALDRGCVTIGNRSVPVVELELELQSGAPDALFALARRLQLTFPVALSTVTKADRGFALADGGDLAPRRFRQPALARDMTTGEAFRVAARAALEQIVWNAALVRQAPSPEAIHQVRVGVRRLRATMSIFKSAVADEERHRLRERLKTLGKELDEARNLDVFLDGAWRRTPREARPGADETALNVAKTAAYERARAAMTADEARAVALDALSWIEIGAWTLHRAPKAKRRDRPIAVFAAKSLTEGRAHLIETGRSLAKLTPDARHRVRIRTKVLRYAAEVLAPVFPEHPKRATRYLAALEALSETLGELNDIATARVIVSLLPAGLDLAAERTGQETALIAAAEKAFHQFRKATPFWET